MTREQFESTLSVAQVEAFQEAVVQEVYRAIQKFPSSYASTVALTEEVGELAKAILSESWERVYAEAVQVAAMALRVACEGDASLDPIRLGLPEEIQLSPSLRNRRVTDYAQTPEVMAGICDSTLSSK